MKYQRVHISNKLFLCSIIFFLLLMSASVTHAEDYQLVTKWGFPGSVIGEFNSPRGAAVDSSGNVYVADTENHRIQKFDSDGGYLASWGSSGSGDGQFSYPHGVAVDSSGNIYVVDTQNNRIQKFDSYGNFLTQWGSSGTGDGEFSNPQGIAVDPSLGDVYVADTGNNRIQRFDSSGGFISTWGSSGTGNGEFSNPQGIAIDSVGTAYVVDTGNNRIQMFGTNGIFLYTWGSSGNAQGEFNVPTGIAFDSSNNVYVVDTSNTRIQKFDSSGMFITTWGYYGTDDGQFSNPQGIAVDSSGSVYVADSDNDRIQKFAKIDPVFPVANFSSNVTSGYFPLSVQFTDLSENATGWNWDFGDGNTSTDQNPTHIYSAAGNYTVNLTASNLNGTNSTFANIIVSEPPVLPVADFSSNVISGYAPLSVQFTDSSENATGWNWDFGDGNTSTEQNPTHIYSSVGNYAVNLTVSNENGTNSAFTDITVLEQPVAYQSVAYISNSASNTVSVIDTTDNTVKATVNVENNPWGVAATLDGKVYVANDQSHTVSVIDVATNTVTATVPVGNTPFGVAANLNGTKIYVTNQGSNNVSVIDTATDTVTASVDVESIPAGIAVNPAGTKVYVTQENGNVSVIDTANNTVIANVSVGGIPTGITVSPTGRKAYVTSQNTVYVIDTVTNTVTTSVDVGLDPAGVAVSPDGTKVYVANMGSSTVSVIDTASNTVTTTVGVGSYPFGVAVTLDGTKAYVANTNSNDVSVIDTASNTVITTVPVGNSPFAFGQFIGPKLVLPVANFSANVTSGYVPLSVQFSDSSVNATGWNWDFGDGSNSTEQNPTHIYSAIGNYTVNLTASNGNGTNSTFATITVSEVPVLPVANFSTNVTSGYAPLLVQFNDSSENATGWNWDFGDGFNSTEQNPTHTFSAAGNYTVNLTASNGNGTNSTFATITVSEVPVLPVANFSTNISEGYVPLSVQFTDLSENAIGWNWDFGNGFNSTEQNPMHTFSATGNYTVNLTVSNGNGTNSTFATITVSEVPVLPVANFSINVSEGYAPLSIQFTDLSENATGWNWDFEDENSSTEQNPMHTYSSAGNYTVNLTASNGNGTNSTFATITVSEVPVLPVANFSTNVTSGYAPLSVQFNDSSENAIGWNWDFGDGVNSTEQNPTHTFSAAGNYTVNLTASNGNDTNSTFAIITVSEQPVLPVANFSTNVSEGYVPLSVQFNDSSENAIGWNWNFGDGFNSTEQNPMHTFSATGNYTVNLTVSNGNGTNSTFANITVSEQPVLPVANFSANVSEGYAPLSVQFTDSSENATGWDWNFGDGFNSTEQNPTHTFSAVGNYTVNLTASNGNGTNSTFATTTVSEQPVLPVASFSSNVTEGYVPLSVQFNDSSENAIGWNWDFGDGNTSTDQNPTHTYSAVGNYTVNLTASNGNGTNSTFANITVSEQPVPAYTINKIIVDVSGNGSSANVTKAGDIIGYQINVSNTGNIDLTNVSVTDPLLGNLTGPSGDNSQTGILNVGENWTYTGTYNATQADLNSNGDGDGFINNTATVDCDELDQINDSAEVPIEQAPAYSINKTITDVDEKGPEGNVTTAGDVINYQINVTNDGNIDLTNVTVTDPLINLTEPAESLADDGILEVGENWTYNGNYTVTQDNINNNGEGDGFINNTAAVGCDQLDPQNDSAEVSIEQNPSYAIDKTVADVDEKGPGGNVTTAGDIITYQVSVTNDGNIDLINVSVSDSLISLTEPSESLTNDGVLEVGENWTYIGNYTVTQADLNNNGGGDGFVNNTATIDCDQLEPKSASAEAPIEWNPAYTINKTVADIAGKGPEGNVTKAGDIISYYVNVTNDGNIDLTNVSVTDSLISLIGPVESLNANGILEVGEYWTYTGNYTVTQVDLNSNGGGEGFINNTATVDCDQLDKENDSVEVPVEQNPAYTIGKTVVDVSGNGALANVTQAGDLISYQVNVTNDGNIDLTNVGITDPLINLTEPTESLIADDILEVGETWAYTGTYNVTQTDLNSNGGGDGFINNTATVDCDELDPQSDSSDVRITRAPAYSIEKIVTDVDGKGSEGNVNSSGDVINYQINVNNTGNIDLINVNVTDPLLGNLTGPAESGNADGILEVGETWAYTGTYTITQADLNSDGDGDGFINNTATVDCDELNELNDSAEVPVEQNPAYTIDKTVTGVSGNGSSANVTVAGDVISYQISVNNTGNIDLTNVNISDPLLGNLTGPIGDDSQTGILNVGENWTYVGNYTVTQEDLNNNGGGDGLINNTATVDCNELDPINDSAEVPVEQNPSYGINKTVADVAEKGPKGNVTFAGDVISYQVNVTNDGNIDLTNVSVSDSLIELSEPAESQTADGILEVEETWIYSGNYTVIQADLNSNGEGDGFINNTATVDCDELDQITDSAEVPIEQNFAYTIDKTVTDISGNGSEVNVTKAGDVISYQINVSNTGNIDLTNVSVTDPLLGNLTGPSGDNSQTGILNVGDNWTYTGTYTVSQADLNSNGGGDGFINNTATVDCDELDPESDTAEVPIEQNPAYTIDKTVIDVGGNGSEANVTKAGDIVSYQINVTNDGNIDLNNVTVTDPLLGTLASPTGDNEPFGILNVGENWTYVGNYTVTQEDMNNNGGNGGGDGFINNTVTVDCDEMDQENDSVEVSIEQNPAYTIDKTILDVADKGPEGNVAKASDVISYQVNVTNNGNIDLTNVSIFDSLIELPEPAESQTADGILEVGEIWIYTGNYTVIQADLNSNGEGDGFINNTATVDCDQLDQENDSVEVPIEWNPVYSIDKTVTDVAGSGPEGNVTSAGDAISYQINVTNDGNIDLTNVSVSDSLINLTGPLESQNQYLLTQSTKTFQVTQENVDGILEVGETWTYFGNYTVTQADLNSNGEGDGFINDIATVECDQLDPKFDSDDVPVEQNFDYCFYKSVIEVDNGGDCIVDDAGDIIRYRIVVKNEGNVDLTGISVNDTLTSLSGPTGDDVDLGVLNPGEIWKFYGNYTVTQEDLNNNGGGDGDIDNTATVICNELPGKNCSVSQPIAQDMYLCIYKSAIGADNAGDCIVNEAGDIIEYQIAVKNDGKVDLIGVSVSDPMITLMGPSESKATDGVLSVGELWTYFGNYTVTQEDINSNGGGDEDIDNTATMSCSELSDGTSSIEVPLIITRTIGTGTDSGSNDTNVTDDDNSGTDNSTNSTGNENSSSGDSSHSSGNSGGSSGGAGVSPEPAKNVEVKEISQAFVTSGNSVKFNFPKNATSVTYITFDAKKTAGKTTTIIEMLKGKSTLVSELPSGEVYKSFNIWVGNSGFANSKNIENAVIGFKVEKAWLQDKGIDSSSIILNRYSDNKWNELPASLSGEDDKYLYFTAKTSGFSPFAVTAKTTAKENDVEVKSEENTEDVQENGENTKVDVEQQTENEENKSSGESAPGFEMIYGIAGLLVVSLHKRR